MSQAYHQTFLGNAVPLWVVDCQQKIPEVKSIYDSHLDGLEEAPKYSPCRYCRYCPREKIAVQTLTTLFRGLLRLSVHTEWRCGAFGDAKYGLHTFSVHIDAKYGVFFYWEGWFVYRKTTMSISFFQNERKGPPPFRTWYWPCLLAAVMILIYTNGWYIPAHTSAIFHTSSSNSVGAGCNLQFAYQKIPTIAEMCQLRRENDRLRAALAPGTAWCALYCSPALKFCAGSFPLRYNPLLWE